MSWLTHVIALIGIVAVVAGVFYRKGKTQGMTVLKGALALGLITGAACWLFALLVLDVTSRFHEKADFQRSFDATRSYIRSAMVLFTLLGAYAGAALAWVWYYGPEDK